MQSPISLPRWTDAPGGAARTIVAIDGWAASDAMAAVVRAFGGSVPLAADGAALLAWLEDFSALRWDFRAGRERNLADRAILPTGTERLILERASELGLAGPYPPLCSEYDVVIMTGGMIRAGIVKPRFVRELLASGVRTRSVVFLGGFRPFAGDEQALAQQLGVTGADEFDAMVGGLELAFGPLGSPTITESVSANPNASWRSWSWDVDGVRMRVVAAPSSEPLVRRANTADTYRFWADETSRTEQSVLVVTTPIYVPYQGAVAVETLGVEHGLAVETVGVSASASDLGDNSQVFEPQHHLQELRSAIRAMRSLRAKLTAAR